VANLGRSHLILLCFFTGNKWQWQEKTAVEVKQTSSLKQSPFLDKTAELSQRQPHDAPNIRVPRKISRVLT